MTSFDTTRVYLNTRRSKYEQPAVIYRVPVPLVNESFYFNQEAIKATVYYKNRSTSFCKKSDIASIHLTNKRLVLLSQSTSIAPADTNYFDTCEMQLSDFQSLKSDTKLHKRRLRFDIETIRNETIRIDIKFKNKKDANRRESLKEYIKMATSANTASQFRHHHHHYYQQQQTPQDNLPSYFEATHCSNNAITAPPAYS